MGKSNLQHFYGIRQLCLSIFYCSEVLGIKIHLSAVQSTKALKFLAPLGCLLALALHATQAHAQSAGLGSLRAQFGLSLWRARLSVPNAADRLNALRALDQYAAQACAADDECVNQLEERFSSETDATVQSALVDCYVHVAGPRGTHTVVLNAVNRTTLAPAVGAHALALVGRRLSSDDFDTIVSAAVGSSWTQHQGLFAAAMDALSHAPDEVFADRVNAHRANSAHLAVILSAIAKRGDPRWGSVVIEQLSGDIAVRTAAANAAASLRLLEAATPLARIAMSPTDTSATRATALRALAVVGAGNPEQTQRAIMQGLREPETREAAQYAAARLGMQSVTAEIAGLLRARWSVDRRNTAQILGELGGPAAARALIVALDSERDQGVRQVLWRSALRADPPTMESALRAERAPDEASRWGAIELGLRSGRWISHASAQGSSVAAMVIECALGQTAATIVRLREPNLQQRTNAAWALTFAPANAAVERAVLLQLNEERVPLVKALLWIVAGHNDSLAVRQRLVENFVGTPGVLSTDVLVALDVASRLGVHFSTAWAVELLSDHRASVRALGAWVVRRLTMRLAMPLLRRVAAGESHAEARLAEFSALGLSEVDSREAGRWSAEESEFSGDSTLRVDGTIPNSLWSLWLPGGSMALAIANSDGVVVVPNVSAGPMAMDSIE